MCSENRKKRLPIADSGPDDDDGEASEVLGDAAPEILPRPHRLARTRLALRRPRESLQQ